MSDKKKTTQETKETNFQGPVSLDAIFAATSKNKVDSTESTNKQSVAPIKEEVEEIEEVLEVKEKEEVKTPIASEEVVKEEVEIPTGETEAFKTAKRLLSLGVLEDFEIQDPNNEEASIKVSEFSQMTDANLEELVQLNKKEKEENISSNYISKEGLKEHQLKVIQILQNGGDLSQIAESPDKAFERPFEGYDLDDQKRQIDVVYTDLVHSKGLSPKKAQELIRISVKQGTLKEESQEIFDLYRDAHSKYIDEKLEEQRKAKEFKDLNFKENKKSLTAKLKEAGFKESVYKKVSSAYGKRNENGDYALIDKLREVLDNPEEHYEVILHLTDKKLFNETFKIKASQEAQKTIVRLASGASQKSTRQTQKSNSTSEVQAPWLKVAEAHNSQIKK